MVFVRVIMHAYSTLFLQAHTLCDASPGHPALQPPPPRFLPHVGRLPRTPPHTSLHPHPTRPFAPSTHLHAVGRAVGREVFVRPPIRVLPLGYGTVGALVGPKGDESEAAAVVVLDADDVAVRAEGRRESRVGDGVRAVLDVAAGKGQGERGEVRARVVRRTRRGGEGGDSIRWCRVGLRHIPRRTPTPPAPSRSLHTYTPCVTISSVFTRFTLGPGEGRVRRGGKEEGSATPPSLRMRPPRSLSPPAWGGCVKVPPKRERDRRPSSKREKGRGSRIIEGRN